MIPPVLKEYFTFSKKERNAVVVLVFLVITVFSLPRFFNFEGAPGKLTVTSFLHDSVLVNAPSIDQSSGAPTRFRSVPGKKEGIRAATLFIFDPNTLSLAGWKKTGLPEKTIATIQHYLSKGGRFREPSDLYRIYGLRKQDAEKLIPFVSIAKSANNPPRPFPFPAYAEKSSVNQPKGHGPAIIDINQADTTAFIALPGIGSKLASRIIRFRDLLGGFYDASQVAETYGLPDSTFESIKRFLRVEAFKPVKININTADLDRLKKHPYLRWQAANAIVSYRSQHGNFNTIDDLRQVDLITPGLFKKLSPYLTVD